jgi:hypothetical protein
MRNMITKSEREAHVEDHQPFDYHGPRVQVNDVPDKFSAFSAIQQEICNRDKHNCLQEDLVEHLWARRGNAQ